MAIDIRIPTVLRKHTEGERNVTGSGGTLGELIDDVGDRHTGLREALMTDDGNLHRYVNVYVNDEDVRYLDGVSTPLEDGDTVSVLPAVAGGS